MNVVQKEVYQGGEQDPHRSMIEKLLNAINCIDPAFTGNKNHDPNYLGFMLGDSLVDNSEDLGPDVSVFA